ncbi:PREDICTED: serine/threonine-protein kinase AFC2-like [Ipomoea nil]|uniref:serine/threonine-protein kinase AFC2-like n=1 Tax=Ipomoea nil TaxID=35883 RepID=UPI000900F1FD|nr:PREDICTED: serine/threonine-protein kinase AFC2-like [Ipomoea nil]
MHANANALNGTNGGDILDGNNSQNSLSDGSLPSANRNGKSPILFGQFWGMILSHMDGKKAWAISDCAKPNSLPAWHSSRPSGNVISGKPNGGFQAPIVPNASDTSKHFVASDGGIMSFGPNICTQSGTNSGSNFKGHFGSHGGIQPVVPNMCTQVHSPLNIIKAHGLASTLGGNREAAMIEVDVLQQLGKHDKGGNRCVQIRNWFDYRNHVCIVFEKLGPSLYDFLRKNNYRSFPIDLVREIGRQLLECVAFIHDLHLIHTDLKPENILLVSPEYVKVPDYKCSSRSLKDTYFKRVPKSSAIKVIDFGSITYDRENQTYIVSTRHYRAPEVILGLGWTYPCDIWSVGCILVELCSGEALFQTHENLEHLAMMERVLGPMPLHMLKRVDRDVEKYLRKGMLDWPEGAASRESIRTVLKLPRLQNLVMKHVDHSVGDLINLLQGLLRYDPSERLTAREALQHPFFSRDHLRRL